MFIIKTQIPQQQEQLEEEHRQSKYNQFHVSIQEAPAISSFLDCIVYQIYKNHPSLLAKIIVQFTKDCLNLTLSLTTFRKVVEMIKQLEDQLGCLNEYFSSLDIHLQEKSQRKKQNALINHARQSKIYELTHLDFLSSIDHKELNPQQYHKIGQPPEQNPFSTLQTLLMEPKSKQLSNGGTTMKNLIDSICFIKEELPKKYQRREEAQSSRAISDFSMTGMDVMSQQSLQGMIQEERFYDQERETQLALKMTSSDQSLIRKFRKKMKLKLMAAKIKPKRKI